MLQVLSVHYVEGSEGDVRVTFSGAVNAAQWTPSWLQLDDTGVWIAGTSVVQETATSLLFNCPDFPNGLGVPWQLTGHPAGLSAPYTGVLT